MMIRTRRTESVVAIRGRCLDCRHNLPLVQNMRTRFGVASKNEINGHLQHITPETHAKGKYKLSR